MMSVPIDHGKPEDWAILNPEETRCILGLKKFYIVFEANSEEVALERAWADLKKEFDRLEIYTWFK